MSFERTKIVKGRKYRYLETRWRDKQTKKMRSKSQYLGPVYELPSEDGHAWTEQEALAHANDKYRESIWNFSSESSPSSEPTSSSPSSSPTSDSGESTSSPPSSPSKE